MQTPEDITRALTLTEETIHRINNDSLFSTGVFIAEVKLDHKEISGNINHIHLTVPMNNLRKELTAKGVKIIDDIENFVDFFPKLITNATVVNKYWVPYRHNYLSGVQNLRIGNSAEDNTTDLITTLNVRANFDYLIAKVPNGFPTVRLRCDFASLLKLLPKNMPYITLTVDTDVIDMTEGTFVKQGNGYQSIINDNTNKTVSEILPFGLGKKINTSEVISSPPIRKGVDYSKWEKFTDDD